ncbi:MAG: RNA polymerase sigma factor [Candidatus Omnitrophica bacterium]|nr:RNA polymerase sigma factor [Candidatus Omnitrophota bacterium]
MKEIPDVVLEEAAGGSLAAFEEIYKSASGFVYSVALRVIQDRADAEEVTQDVFIKVYKHLSSFESRSSFKTWLYRITVNTALNYTKKIQKERLRRRNDERILENQEVPAEAENRLDQEDKEKAVQVLLSTLNPDQRACIVLREIEGLDYAQIASALGINLNTVRSRLKRAREALMAQARKGVMKK